MVERSYYMEKQMDSIPSSISFRFIEFVNRENVDPRNFALAEHAPFNMILKRDGVLCLKSPKFRPNFIRFDVHENKTGKTSAHAFSDLEHAMLSST